MENKHNHTLDKFELFTDIDLSRICGGHSADIADNLKMLRVTSGMSRGMLAEELMVDPTSVTHWEHGRRIPDVDTLIEISRIFNTTVDNIIR